MAISQKHNQDIRAHNTHAIEVTGGMLTLLGHMVVPFSPPTGASAPRA